MSYFMHAVRLTFMPKKGRYDYTPENPKIATIDHAE